MIIEVYNTISNKCTTVVEKGFKDEDCEIFIREIEGVDYNDCMRQHHELMGWEPYIPFDEEE
jgi:hypothetical protein